MSQDRLEAVAWLNAQAAALGAPLTEEQQGQFARYLELLLEWNERAGLTSLTEPVEVVRRHFAESIACGVALRRAGLLADGVSVVDIGSGGGLPGLPLRITWPQVRVTLVEASGRRCRFLEAVIEDLGLAGTEVVQARAEDAGRAPEHRGAHDLVVARAVAPLAVLVEYALPLLRPGGTLAALKGSRALEEIETARGAVAALGGAQVASLEVPLPAGSTPQQLVLVRRDGALGDRYPRRPGIPAKRPLK